MFKRLRNLWELSQFKAHPADDYLADDELVLRRDVFVKPKGKATIIDLKPPEEMFPDHKETI